MVKSKLKPILPSLREKKRYLAFEVISKKPITELSSVSNAIYHSSAGLFGTIDTSKSGLLFLKERWNPEKQRGILRIGHKHVDNIRASLAMIDKIDHEEVIVQSLGISGILKKAANKYLAA